MEKYMCVNSNCFRYSVIGIAVVVSLLAALLPQEQLHSLGLVSRFFEIMIPFLAVGSLVKYLFTDTK
jgi:hypothetical protein